MVSLKQPAFSGGLVSPQLLGRSDLQKYATGLRQCTNAWVTRYGTVENRPGTVLCAAVKDSTAKLREVPFVFSASISYLLEFGNNYVRVFKQGARVSVAGSAAWGIAVPYNPGDLVTYSGQAYRCLLISTGDVPSINPTIWNLQVGGLLEIKTTIPQAALALMQYVQRNDIMTITAQQFAPVQLKRYSDTKWLFAAFTQSTGIAAPTGVAVTGVSPSSSIDPPSAVGASGGVNTGQTDSYRILSWNASIYSLATNPQSVAVGFVATAGNPITVTWTASGSGGVLGYGIYKTRHGSGLCGLIALVDSTVSSFIDSDVVKPASSISTAPTGGTGTTSYTYEVTAISALTGGESLASSQATVIGATPSSGQPNIISWDAVSGASKYRIYRVIAGVPGFIGEQPASPFNDTNFIPDTSIQPPVPLSLFTTSSDYPAVCGYYQQRLGFANTVNQPQTVLMSRVGNDYDFTVSTPVLDDDAIQFTIAGRQVQDIRALVDLGKLIIHTSNGEYIGQGNQSGTLTPSAISLVANGSAGSSFVAPVVIGNTDLFVQAASTRINDLRYDVQSFSYSGKDLTKLTADVFSGRTIVDLAWQKKPHSILWCVLDNGQVAGLTYVREDELWAWHLHTSTNGAFENVAVVPEGTQDVVYFVVNRTIAGATKRTIERLADRSCLDTVFFSDSIFVDSALVYDGRNTTSHTITASLGSGWTPTDTVTLTASASTFVAGDVGNQIVFQKLDATTGLIADLVTFQIVGYTSTTIVTALPLRTVPTWARTLALTTWGKAVKSFSGASHLEGQSLAILGDGNVDANPLDASFDLITVVGGAFTLVHPRLVVTAGLPIQTDLETLPVENTSGESIINKHVQVREVTPIFHQSRGGLFGQDDTHLDAWKQPKTSAMGYPVDAVTGPYRVPIRGTPQRTGQVHIRHTEPTPFGLSAIVLTGEVGG